MQAQLPVSVGVLLSMVLAWFRSPELVLTPLFLVGFALVAGASLGLLLVPWSRLHSGWLVAIPIADLLGVVLFADSLLHVFPAVVFLAVFPVVWMAYGFPPWATGLAIALSVIAAFSPGRPDAWQVELRNQWENDLLLAVLATVTAVTARIAAGRLRRYERALLNSRRELRRSLTAADDTSAMLRAGAEAVGSAVAFFDAQGKPLFRNPAAERAGRLAGYDDETGNSSAAFAADGRTPLLPSEQLVPRLLRGDDIASLFYWVGPPDDRHALLSNARRVRRASGELRGVVVVAHDVTELAHAVEMRDTFMASVSHELRTPLTSVIGFLDVIDDLYDIDAQPFGRELRTVQRSSEQLFALIGDLLSASPSDISLSLSRLDVSALAVEAVLASSPRADAGGIAVTSEVEPELLADADPARLRQVLDNLLTNAIKYTPAGGSVHVDVRRDGERVQIVVSDTGTGISVPDQQRLFERFFRAGTAREDAVQGVGLGLSIVKMIVDAHLGTIEIDSAVGEGSAFIVRLPLHRPAPSGPAAPGGVTRASAATGASAR